MIQWSDFFKILSIEKGESKFNVAIELNPDHEIFKGHFPGNPVVPGVCMVQIIKEILKEIYGRDFTMQQASQLKFLAIINPNENKSAQVEIIISKEAGNELTVSGSIHKDKLVFLKYKAVFTGSYLKNSFVTF
jgi:3-hydroxyacyl-[acyl-carrier-protein] dehydratase